MIESSEHGKIGIGRIARATLVGFSTLVSIVAAAFLLRSVQVRDGIVLTRGIDPYRFDSVHLSNYRGSLCLGITHWFDRDGGQRRPAYAVHTYSRLHQSPADTTTLQAWQRGNRFAGFAMVHWRPPPSRDEVRTAVTFVAIPLWLVAVLAAVPPARRLVIWRRRARARRRLERGCCPNCGYDIRATPQEKGALLERCPECGQVLLGSAKASG